MQFKDELYNLSVKTNEYSKRKKKSNFSNIKQVLHIDLLYTVP
jgi:hypothetical protein